MQWEAQLKSKPYPNAEKQDTTRTYYIASTWYDRFKDYAHLDMVNPPQSTHQRPVYGLGT